MIEIAWRDQFERKTETKNEIVEFLLQQKSGASVNEVWKGLGKSMTRQTIHNHLRDLIAERIVRKTTKHLYFLEDLDLYQRHWCGQILGDAASVLLKPDLTGSQYPQSLIQDLHTAHISDFVEEVSELIPSDEFCKTRFGKSNNYEKFFFDFANRMGAYISYIFLESMRPSRSDNRKIELDSRKQYLRKKYLSMEFIHRSTNLELFFDLFRERLKELEFDRILLNNSKKKLPNYPHEPRAREFNNSEFIETEYADFERLWKKYRKIYPTVYDALAKYWDEATLSVGLDLEVQESLFKIKSQCKHRWKEIKIYKKEGKYFECLKCLKIANEWMVKKLKSREVN